jgi:hypothetical protein
MDLRLLMGAIPHKADQRRSRSSLGLGVDDVGSVLSSSSARWDDLRSSGTIWRCQMSDVRCRVHFSPLSICRVSTKMISSAAVKEAETKRVSVVIEWIR